MSLYRAQERLLLARLQIELIKTLHKGRISRRSSTNLAGEVELLMISGAVLVGHVMRTPRNSAEISRFLGIPRPTVQRKLATLVKRGIIYRIEHRRYRIVDRKPGDDYSYIDVALSLVRDAARKSLAIKE